MNNEAGSTLERAILTSVVVTVLIAGIAIGLNSSPHASPALISAFTALGAALFGGSTVLYLFWRRPGILSWLLLKEQGVEVTSEDLVEATVYRFPPKVEDEHCPGA